MADAVIWSDADSAAPLAIEVDGTVIELVRGGAGRGVTQRVEVAGDPEAALTAAATAWMRERYGGRPSVGTPRSAHRRRFRFAATEAHALARAALPGWGDAAPIRQVVPDGRDRVSTRIVPFEAPGAGALVVVVGAHEPTRAVELALPYALALLGERELRLVVPHAALRPMRERLPSLDIHARLYGHVRNDSATVREVPLPTRAAVIQGYGDALVTTVADLGERAAWVDGLMAWADDHEHLVPAHRPSYLGWHCCGRKVLEIRSSDSGLVVTGGVLSPLATHHHVTVEVESGDHVDDAWVRRAVDLAVARRLDGSDDDHREHRLQARLAEPELLARLGIEEAWREVPCVRPTPSGHTRAYIDLLGRGVDGRLHVIETKLGLDPMLPLQGLDYQRWCQAHAAELADRLGADPSLAPQLDLVVMREPGGALLDRFARATLERIDRSSRWRIWGLEGDLLGPLALSTIPRAAWTTGTRWADRMAERVTVATRHAGVELPRGRHDPPTSGLAPLCDEAASGLEDRGALHPWFGHPRSSQRFTVNLFGSLDRRGSAALLGQWFGEVADADPPELEWSDPLDRLGEATAARPPRTQVDVVLRGRARDGRRVAALIEVKLTETGFGACSHAEVAPEHQRSACRAAGPFGGAPEVCWQLAHRELGGRRRYDEVLRVVEQPADPPAGCWYRELNQPMRSAALASALETSGDADEVVVVLCAPLAHEAVWRQWRQAKSVIGERLEDLDPSVVAEVLPAATQAFLSDRYGIVAASASDEWGDLVPRWQREVLGWRFIAEVVARNPGRVEVIETHPGGGQYDCLALYGPGFDEHLVDLNREGRIHTWAWESPPTTWTELRASGAAALLGTLSAAVARSGSCADAATSAEVVTAMADVVATLARPGRGWAWRAGFHDTSGEGAGPRTELLQLFPEAEAAWRAGGTRSAEVARQLWFLADGEAAPIAAVDITGSGWVGGSTFDLVDDVDRAAFVAAAVRRATRAGPSGADDDPHRWRRVT